MKNQINNWGGFTLIEFLIVISLVVILGSFSAVFYSRFLTQNNVSTIQDQYIGELRKAQAYAMVSKRGTNWGVNYNAATRSIRFYQGSSYTGTFIESFTVASNISMTSTGSFDINFTRISGLPTSGVNTTITIAGNNTTRTITVESSGRITR